MILGKVKTEMYILHYLINTIISYKKYSSDSGFNAIRPYFVYMAKHNHTAEVYG